MFTLLWFIVFQELLQDTKAIFNVSHTETDPDPVINHAKQSRRQ